MIASNEVVFFLHLLAAGAILLFAGRLGRAWLTALVVTCTLLMNIAVFKQMNLFGLAVTGGNVLFASVFLANDVLNEHFGKRAARSAVFTGFATSIAVVVLMQFVLWYTPNEYDEANGHLGFFFNVGAYPRIVVASMLSYLFAQLLDTQLYQMLKRKTGESRLLWLRSNGSTWVSQAFDTVFFTTAGLTGYGGIIHSWVEWRDAVIFAYIIKIVVAAAQTPFLYLTTWRPFVPAGSQRGVNAPDRRAA